MCPSSWPGFCKWGRCASHSSAKSEQEILEEMFKKICKQCPVKEEIHTDDKQCAESCEGCLVRSVYLEDLRSKQGEQRWMMILKHNGYGKNISFFVQPGDQRHRISSRHSISTGVINFHILIGTRWSLMLCEGRLQFDGGLFLCNPACISPLRHGEKRCRIGYLVPVRVLLLPPGRGDFWWQPDSMI